MGSDDLGVVRYLRFKASLLFLQVGADTAVGCDGDSLVFRGWNGGDRRIGRQIGHSGFLL